MIVQLDPGLLIEQVGQGRSRALDVRGLQRFLSDCAVEEPIHGRRQTGDRRKTRQRHFAGTVLSFIA